MHVLLKLLKQSLPKALQVSFGGGTVMGLGVAGLAVLGLTLLFLFFVGQFMGQDGSFYDTHDGSLRGLSWFLIRSRVDCIVCPCGEVVFTPKPLM